MKAIKSKLPSCSGTLQVELKVQNLSGKGREGKGETGQGMGRGEEGGRALHLLTVVGENISPLFGVFGAAKYAMLLSPRSAVQINCRICGYAVQCGWRRGSVIRLQMLCEIFAVSRLVHSLFLCLALSLFLLHIPRIAFSLNSTILLYPVKIQIKWIDRKIEIDLKIVSN